MRGARHYRPDVPTRLKKCSEHIGDDCTLCCAVTPCAYCIELEIYGGAIYTDYAPESADHWTGTVDGHAFDAFWERNQYTDECEFVVELDAVEVYRKSCYEGQECRDSSDETGVTIGYDEATLRWTKHEPLELPHIIGDTGCPTFFCGSCECSCTCVCVTITDTNGTISKGELCNVAYECEGPRWEGQIGYFDLALALGRDSYGNCVLGSTIDGEEQAAVAVVGCKDMSATITLYDGTTIEVSCKICSCEEDTSTLCCGGRDLQGSLQLTLVNPGTGFGCGNTILTLTQDVDGIWYADGTVSVEVPGGGGEECVDMTAHFRFFCDPGGPIYQLEWYFEYLGTRTPTAGWCSLVKASEDCDYPYLATWDENTVECGGFWNGVITFLVEET